MQRDTDHACLRRALSALAGWLAGWLAGLLHGCKVPVERLLEEGELFGSEPFGFGDAGDRFHHRRPVCLITRVSSRRSALAACTVAGCKRVALVEKIDGSTSASSPLVKHVLVGEKLSACEHTKQQSKRQQIVQVSTPKVRVRAGGALTGLTTKRGFCLLLAIRYVWSCALMRHGGGRALIDHVSVVHGRCHHTLRNGAQSA